MKGLFKSMLLVGFGLVAHRTEVLSQTTNEIPLAGAPYSPYPGKVTVTKVMHFDNLCWKIAMAGGTFYFETGETKGRSGFSSAFDMAGNDWIGNDADRGYNKSPSNGGKHEYRGYPNFGEGNFCHPQRTTAGIKSMWVKEDGTAESFAGKLEGDHLILKVANAEYDIEIHCFASHGSIKVLKAANKYAFLFEGPIGGEQEASVEKDFYVIKSGAKNTKWGSGLGYLDPAFGNNFPSPYYYLVDADPKDAQVWYSGTKNWAPASAGDEGWIQGTNMVIFSHGRDQDKRAYTGTTAINVFGFARKAAHDSIDGFISARLAAPFSAAGTGTTGNLRIDADYRAPWSAGNLRIYGDGRVRVMSVQGSGYSLYGLDGAER